MRTLKGYRMGHFLADGTELVAILQQQPNTVDFR
jgi:hypothetical protein